MADGDDEAGVDEEHQLADLDHLLGVDVAGGLDDDEEGVAVELELGPLVRFDRVLDRQLVEVESAGDLPELLRRRFEHAEPDEGPVPARRRAGLVEREVVAAAQPFLVGGALDDHRGSIAPAAVASAALFKASGAWADRCWRRRGPVRPGPAPRRPSCGHSEARGGSRSALLLRGRREVRSRRDCRCTRWPAVRRTAARRSRL